MNETIDVTATSAVLASVEPTVIEENLKMVWNKQEITEYLENALSKYEKLVVTEDNLKEMKSALREVISYRTKLSKFGTEKKRELKIPYNTLTSELEQVLAVVSRVESPIANQIGEFEKQEMLKRKEAVLNMVEDKAQSLGIREEYKNRVRAMPNPKWWENKTAKMSDVAMAIEEVLKNVKQEQDQYDENQRLQADKKAMLEMKVDLFNANYELNTPISFEEIYPRIAHLPFEESENIIREEFEKRMNVELAAARKSEEKVVESVTPIVTLSESVKKEPTETVTYVIKNVTKSQVERINSALNTIGVTFTKL